MNLMCLETAEKDGKLKPSFLYGTAEEISSCVEHYKGRGFLKSEDFLSRAKPVQRAILEYWRERQAGKEYIIPPDLQLILNPCAWRDFSTDLRMSMTRGSRRGKLYKFVSNPNGLTFLPERMARALREYEFDEHAIRSEAHQETAEGEILTARDPHKQFAPPIQGQSVLDKLDDFLDI